MATIATIFEALNVESKVCTKCGVEQLLSEFSPHNLSKDGRQTRCKTCIRDYQQLRAAKGYVQEGNLIRRYGINLEDFVRLSRQQNSVCKICGSPDGDKKGRRLSIDHDHDTGEVRGLLCNRCNRAIGMFNDDIELMKQAISYLEEFQN
jgi:hypothetical protein